MRRSNVQFGLAVVVVIFTFAMATAGFFVSPLGDIYGSILALIGEFLSFAAALFGFTSKYHHEDATPPTPNN